MSLKKQAKSLVERPAFHKVVSLMIILCSVVMGLDTMYDEDVLILKIIDDFFLLFFAAEIILRLLAEDRILDFFRLIEFRKKSGIDLHMTRSGADGGLSTGGILTTGSLAGGKKQDAKMLFDQQPDTHDRKHAYTLFHVNEQAFWNVFDFTIVVISSISLFSYIFPHPEFLIVSRLFRVLRVLRLLDMSESLKAVERKIVSIIPTIFSFGLLLAILLYIYSIIGIYMFGHVDFGHADFTTITSAFMSLFQVMTLDGWSDIMNEVAVKVTESGGSVVLAKTYFISFVILTAIVSFNVFVAVLTSQVYDQLTSGKEEGQTANLNGISEELRKIRQEMEELRRTRNGS